MLEKCVLLIKQFLFFYGQRYFCKSSGFINFRKIYKQCEKIYYLEFNTDVEL